MIDQVVSIVGALGFPIFVTLWFMLRTEKVISKNTEATNELIKVVEKLCVEVKK